MANRSSILAWRIPLTEEPGGSGVHGVTKSWTQLKHLIPVCVCVCPQCILGFPCSSVGKISACNAGDPGLIPGSGRFPGEGNGNPLQYSCLENSMDRGAFQATAHGVKRVQLDLGTEPPPPIYFRSFPIYRSF